MGRSFQREAHYGMHGRLIQPLRMSLQLSQVIPECRSSEVSDASCLCKQGAFPGSCLCEAVGTWWGSSFATKAEDQVDEETQAVISFSDYQVLVIG